MGGCGSDIGKDVRIDIQNSVKNADVTIQDYIPYNIQFDSTKLTSESDELKEFYTTIDKYFQEYGKNEQNYVKELNNYIEWVYELRDGDEPTNKKYNTYIDKRSELVEITKDYWNSQSELNILINEYIKKHKTRVPSEVVTIINELDGLNEDALKIANTYVEYVDDSFRHMVEWLNTQENYRQHDMLKLQEKSKSEAWDSYKEELERYTAEYYSIVDMVYDIKLK